MVVDLNLGSVPAPTEPPPSSRANTVTIKKGYADTTSGQIHFRYALPSASTMQSPSTKLKTSPLVFLHKSASSSASFESLMQQCAEQGYHCFAPDMPGFGGSFDPSEMAVTDIQREGTAWYGRTFVEAFRGMGVFESCSTTPPVSTLESALGAETTSTSASSPSSTSKISPPTKCHLIGHHSGAVLAVDLATSHPELISSICLVGPSVMSVEERMAMKSVFFDPFNAPVPDGTHLLKTWRYLAHMGVGEDLGLWHREAVDHIRAWRGRTLIYGAVWAQDSERLYRQVKCPILLMCARDDVLWKYFDHVKGLRPDVPAVELAGANFEPDRDVDGIQSAWMAFLNEVESSN